MRARLSSLGRSFDALRLAVAALWICITGSSSFGAVLLVPAQFPNIQSAIDASASGDEIVVASGIYAGGIDLRGKRLVIRSQSGAASTIMDLSATGGTGCRVESQEPIGTTLQGFTIRGATTSAIRVANGASLIVRECQIVDSTCTNMPGAGILCVGGDLDVQSCGFSNLVVQYNTSQLVARGGAISLSADAYAVVTNSSFLNCRVSNTTPTPGPDTDVLASEGGAIACDASTLTVSGCTFDGCSASAHKSWVSGEYSGAGTTIARGGALSATNGSSINIQNSHFGVVAPCQAVATLERSRRENALGTFCLNNGLFKAITHGGAVCAREGTLLVLDAVNFASNAAITRVGTWTSSPNQAVFPQTEATSEGGSLHYSSASQGTLQGTGLACTAGQCRLETFPIGSAATPFINNCITASMLGHAACLRPGSASLLVSDSSFRQCADAPVAVLGGTGVSFQRCVFEGNVGTPLTLQGNAALVGQSSFRSNAATPIVNTTAGYSPTVFGSLFCANNPNQISGSWIDGGANTFATVCITNDCNQNGIEDAVDIASGTAIDCNSNGRPDTCDITAQTSDDCDENDIPDECQFSLIAKASPALSPVQSGTTLVHSFTNLPNSGSDVRILVEASADLSSVNETILLKAGKTVVGTLFQVGGADCTPVSGELNLTRNAFNQLLSGSTTLTLQLIPSFAVTAGTCANSWAKVQLLYQPIVAGDCNANASPDICDVLYGKSEDRNQNEIPDECEDLPSCLGDLNLDGFVNAADLSYLLASWGGPSGDLNDDGVTGGADLALMLSLFRDCNAQP